MVNALTDRDVRQLALMQEKLATFDKTVASLASLRHLITNLDGLLNSLEFVDNEWKSAFAKQWGVLEDVYAYALDNNFPDIPGEHIALLSKAVEEIKKLVTQKM